jgi:hypothetical protein
VDLRRGGGGLRLGSGISMLEDGRQKLLRSTGFNGGAVGRGSAGQEKKGLTFGAHMSVTGVEKTRPSGMHKSNGKTPFGECAWAYQADWAERGGSGL